MCVKDISSPTKEGLLPDRDPPTNSMVVFGRYSNNGDEKRGKLVKLDYGQSGYFCRGAARNVMIFDSTMKSYCIFGACLNPVTVGLNALFNFMTATCC